MSLDLIKNDKSNGFNNLLIEKHYIALSIKHISNHIWLRKNLRWRYVWTIVFVMTMLPAKSTFFPTCPFIFVFVYLSRNASWNGTTLCSPLSPWIRSPLIFIFLSHWLICVEINQRSCCRCKKCVVKWITSAHGSLDQHWQIYRQPWRENTVSV